MPEGCACVMPSLYHIFFRVGIDIKDRTAVSVYTFVTKLNWGTLSAIADHK
jgi:hypothetical protein